MFAKTKTIFRERNTNYLEIITCNSLMYTMDLPKFIVSIQKEESISASRVNMSLAVEFNLLSGSVAVRYKTV